MIDFNNDALDLIADALKPLVGEHVTIDISPEGYMHGELILAEATPDGPYIEVQEFSAADYDGGGHASGPVVRLHASEQCLRIRICR